MKFLRYLEQFKYGTNYNFVQTTKNIPRGYGKYTLDKKFLIKYVQSYPSFNSKSPSLVWRVADRDNFYLYLDFDFVSDQVIYNNDKRWAKLIIHVLNLANVTSGDVFATRRVSCYQHSNGKDWKHGFHLYVPGKIVTRADVRSLKDKLMKSEIFLEFLKDENIRNNPDNVIDDVAIKRSNGLYMIGTRKPIKATHSAHYVFLDGRIDGNDLRFKIKKYGWQFKNHERFFTILKRIYKPVFKQTFPEILSKTKTFADKKFLCCKSLINKTCIF